MDAEAFLDASQRVPPPAPTTWMWAIIETILGAILLWVVARSIPQGEPLLRGWVGMLGLILLLHFGTFQIVALAVAERWRQSKSHHVCPSPLDLPG